LPPAIQVNSSSSIQEGVAVAGPGLAFRHSE
jgi:hypothetical protein